MSLLKIIGIIAAVVILVVIYYLFRGTTESPHWIGIMNQDISDKEISLQGTFAESAKAYRGYSVHYNTEILYIKIRSSIAIDIPPFLSRSGDFNITIPNKFGEIKEIYLEGNNPSENKLIWSKK